MGDIEENKKEITPSLNEELKKEYPSTWAEEERELEEKWKCKIGENMKYLELLKDIPFEFNKDGFSYITSYYAPCTISNIFIFPLKMITIDTGEDVKSLVELKGILNTRRRTP